MIENREIFLLYLSARGRELAERIRAFWGRGEILSWDELQERGLTSLWNEGNLLIFIMALGIVVRKCAPLISSKGKDPGVIVIDELGRNVIPLLGGHYAQVNRITQELALFLEAHPAITTASDLLGLTPLDLWIKRKNFQLKNPALLTATMAKLNEKGVLNLWIKEDLPCPSPPQEFLLTDNPEEADLLITYEKLPQVKGPQLIPKCLWLGLGFHEKLSENDFEKIIFSALEDLRIEPSAIKGVATLDKKAKYPPLINFLIKHNLKLLSFSAEELSNINTISSSIYVKNHFGINSVSEACALKASGGKLIVPKRVFQDLTLAIALEPLQSRGRLYVVGIGPGAKELMTVKALRALLSVEAVVGYKSYLKQIEDLIKGKEIYSFSMTEEIRRVKKAIELTLSGKDTALVSGGDPGIYGMAGLTLEVIARNNLSLEVEIIPGLSALNLGNALLGAPLGNDFAVISLSDRLTPWETIERRLKILVSTDLPLVIFNPRSKGRKSQFQRAMEIIKEGRGEETLVGIVNSGSRPEEEVFISTLRSLPEDKVGMHSLVIVGSEAIRRLGRYLIAMRGYERKYEEDLEISFTCQ